MTLAPNGHRFRYIGSHTNTGDFRRARRQPIESAIMCQAARRLFASDATQYQWRSDADRSTWTAAEAEAGTGAGAAR